MENKIESSMEIEETGNYLQHFIYRVPKKNHDAIEPNLRKFVPWFKKNEIRLEDYQLSSNQTMEAMESITKTPSVTEDEMFGSSCSISGTRTTLKMATQR